MPDLKSHVYRISRRVLIDELKMLRVTYPAKSEASMENMMFKKTSSMLTKRSAPKIILFYGKIDRIPPHYHKIRCQKAYQAIKIESINTMHQK